MAQAMPHLLALEPLVPVQHMQRRRTETEGGGPLVDLIKEKKEERSAFTGRGLLKI